jgi:hypothetical protein
LEVGQPADLVLFEWDNEAGFRPAATVVAGRIIKSD